MDGDGEEVMRFSVSFDHQADNLCDSIAVIFEDGRARSCVYDGLKELYFSSVCMVQYLDYMAVPARRLGG